MNELRDILREMIQLYKPCLDLEYDKHEAAIKNDIETLDRIVSEEQVFYMKMRGLEQKREKLFNSMNLGNRSLSEIIDTMEEKQDEFKKLQDELNDILAELKKINSLNKTVIEVQLRRIDKAMKDLGEKENTYTSGKSNDNPPKSLLISRKI